MTTSEAGGGAGDKRRRLAAWGAALLAATAVAVGLSFGACSQDDAFISFRYADNLLAGHGLVYNPGERVEGYTNLSWTLLLAGWMGVGGDPVVGSIVLGLLSLSGAILATGYLARRQAPGALAWLAPALLALDPLTALEAVEGLETLLFALLAAAGVARLLAERDRGLAHTASSWIFALACLTRPEGALVAALAHLGLLAAERARWADQLRASLRGGWPALLTLAALTLWRLLYYGSPLPNTFYAKTGGLALERGALYLWWFFAHHPLLLALLALRPLARLPSRDAPVYAALALAYLAYVAAVGGDFKPTGRFVLPVVPFLALLAGESFAGLWARFRSLPPRAALALAAAAALLGPAWGQLAAAQRLAAERHANLEARRLVGEWLAAHTPASAVLAIHSAGVVPFYAGRRTIDMWGLTDAHIARVTPGSFGEGLAGHEKTDPTYVFSREPDLYLPEDKLLSLRPWVLEPDPTFPADFAEKYRPLSIPLEGRWLNLWVRRGFMSGVWGHPR